MINPDPLKYAIILYDKKSGELVNRCSEICRISHDKDLGKYNISFKNSKNKQFPYNQYNVDILSNPEEMDVSNCIVYSRNNSLIDVSNVVKFIQGCNSWYCIQFQNGELRNYLGKDIIFRYYNENIDLTNKIDYFKEIVATVKSQSKEELFLSNQYKKLKVLNDSILSKYLTGSEISCNDYNKTLIFPYGTNLSQTKAIRNALSNDISIIEGPPGTGKTQTILNLISNILINDKTIAMVAGNNEATRNVQDKLKTKGLDSEVAFLGNMVNVDAFFGDGILRNANDKKEIFDRFQERSLLNKINQLSINIEKSLSFKNEIAGLNQKIKEIENEKNLMILSMRKKQIM